MTQMTNSAVRIIDPILTSVALGYKNQAYKGQLLFPRVPVGVRAGKIITFDRSSNRLYRSRRAPGALVETLDVQYSNTTYSLEDHSLDALIPVEKQQEAGAVPGINMQAISLRKVQTAMGLGLENQQATLARTAGNYGSQVITYNGSTSWNNSASTPLADIAAAREAILATIGVYPNVLLLSNTALKALKNHQSFIDRTKYTSSDAVTTALISKLTEVPTVDVAAVSYQDDSNVTQMIWGNDAILAYVAQGSLDNAEPSYGYTYQLEGYPNAEQVRYDADRRSWKNGWNDARAPLLTGIASGYLFQNAGQ